MPPTVCQDLKMSITYTFHFNIQYYYMHQDMILEQLSCHYVVAEGNIIVGCLLLGKAFDKGPTGLVWLD